MRPHVRERLCLWDAKEDSLSPLTDEEKDSVLLLTAYSSNRSLSSEVLCNIFKYKAYCFSSLVA